MTTEKMKNKVSPDEIVAWVGLDWADSEHRISMYCRVPPDSEQWISKRWSGQNEQVWTWIC